MRHEPTAYSGIARKPSSRRLLGIPSAAVSVIFSGPLEKLTLELHYADFSQQTIHTFHHDRRGPEFILRFFLAFIEST